MFSVIFAVISLSAVYSPMFPSALVQEGPYTYADMVKFDLNSDKITENQMFFEITNNSNSRVLFNETSMDHNTDGTSGDANIFFWRTTANMPNAWDVIMTMDGTTEGSHDGDYIHYETDWANASDSGFFTYDHPRDNWGPNDIHDSHVEVLGQNATYGAIFNEMYAPNHAIFEQPLNFWEINLFDNITISINRTVSIGKDSYTINGISQTRDTRTVTTTATGNETYTTTIHVPLGSEFEPSTLWADITGNITVSFYSQWTRIYDFDTGEVLAGVEQQSMNYIANFLNSSVDIAFDTHVFPSTLETTMSGSVMDRNVYNTTEMIFKPAPEGTAPLMDGDHLEYDTIGTNSRNWDTTVSDTTGYSLTETYAETGDIDGHATVEIYGHNGPNTIWGLVYGHEHVQSSATYTSSEYPDSWNTNWDNDSMFAELWGQMNSTPTHELPYTPAGNYDVGRYLNRPNGPQYPQNNIFGMMIPQFIPMDASQPPDFFIDLNLHINMYDYPIHATASSTHYSDNYHGFIDLWNGEMHYALSYDFLAYANDTAAWDVDTGALVHTEKSLYLYIHAYGTVTDSSNITRDFDGEFTIDNYHETNLVNHPHDYQTPPTSTSTSDTSNTNTSLSNTNSSSIPSLSNPLPSPVDVPMVLTIFIAVYAIRKRK